LIYQRKKTAPVTQNGVSSDFSRHDISVHDEGYYRNASYTGVGMIRVNFGPISETVYIDIILNTIIKR